VCNEAVPWACPHSVNSAKLVNYHYIENNSDFEDLILHAQKIRRNTCQWLTQVPPSILRHVRSYLSTKNFRTTLIKTKPKALNTRKYISKHLILKINYNLMFTKLRQSYVD
jgi:hypothetical protein